MTYKEFEKELIGNNPKVLKITLDRTITCIKESYKTLTESTGDRIYKLCIFLGNVTCLLLLPITCVGALIARHVRLKRDEKI